MPPRNIPTPDREAIRARARALGFDAVRFARAELPPRTRDEFRQFLAEGRAGDMHWLAREPERRADPRALWPGARSVIVVGVNYGPPDDPRAGLSRADQGVVSVYARNRDYHDVLKKRLKALARWLHDTSGAEVKLFVDTAPVLEKPLAQQAGLGWQGKHTNLVSRDFGSWLFLGEVFTTLAIAPDAPETDHCGACHACLDVCPTRAFTAPYRIDARRCISYLTIEHKGVIARDLRPLMGNRIYGCDDCLAVCPWNKFARVAEAPEFAARDSLLAPRLAALAALDDAGFRAMFAGSPIKRIGRDRFVRNVLVAIGNSGDRGLAGVAEALCGDASALVRAHAVWALKRLDPARAAVVHARGAETDPDVLAEWAA
jgi:epoxyqueuosine reductase